MKALVVALLLLPAPAFASLLFDNGSPVGTDLGMLYNSNCRGTSDGSCGWTVYEDFTISERSVITGLGWSQFDEAITYLGTTITILGSSLSSPIITFDLTASRTANGIAGVPYPGTGMGNVSGYDYFAFLGFYLNAGTYFVGIHNEVIAELASGGLAPTLMANTLGTGQTIPGSMQANVGQIAAGTFEIHSSNFAFQMFGEVATVPEPGTLTLLVTGLLGVVLVRRRRAA